MLRVRNYVTLRNDYQTQRNSDGNYNPRSMTYSVMHVISPSYILDGDEKEQRNK